MTEKQQSYALRSKWKGLFEQATGSKWNSSIHRDAAQLKPVLEDIGYDRCVEAMVYYTGVAGSPDFMYFIYNYDKILDAKKSRDSSIEQSRILREKTRERMKEMLGEG